MQLTGLPTKRVLTLCLLAGALAAQKNTPDFENDYVIINAPHPNVDVPGYTHKAHIHDNNRVMIYFQLGGEYLHFLKDGHTEDLKWKEGDVVWSPAEGWHYSEIKKDNPPFTPPMLMDIGIKKAGDPTKTPDSPLDAVKVDPKHYKVEIDNSQVRVLRLKLGPKETAPMHEHALNRLVVYMTDENVRRTTADGKTEVRQHKRAEYSFQGPGKYKLENLGDKPLEAVFIEFKS